MKENVTSTHIHVHLMDRRFYELINVVHLKGKREMADESGYLTTILIFLQWRYIQVGAIQ